MEISTKLRLLTGENPSGYLTTNDLELAAYVAYLHLFSGVHICILVDKTDEE